MPSICGISISSVNTSGFNSLIISRATKAFSAAPTTSISNAVFKMLVKTFLINRESSIIKTRIFFIQNSKNGLFYFLYQAKTVQHRPQQVNP